jgi:hypothetical protein
MNARDPDSWPKGPNLFYRRISHAHPTAHAFERNRSFCGTISLAPNEGAIPTLFYTRLCSKCIKALRSWRYLSPSEPVEQ